MTVNFMRMMCFEVAINIVEIGGELPEPSLANRQTRSRSCEILKFRDDSKNV